MNASELVNKMLEWEQKALELDAIESEIKAAVLEIGKTQTVGNVRATYSQGRKTYDYETAAVEHPMVSEATINLFTFTTKKVDWRAVCNHAGIEEIPVLKQGDPSVTIKLVG